MMVFVLVPVFNESCGTVLSNFTGWLGSEDTDGDGTYENDVDCWWLIATNLYYAIELNITSLDIEDHIICGYDFLEVRYLFTCLRDIRGQ